MDTAVVCDPSQGTQKEAPTVFYPHLTNSVLGLLWSLTQ